MEANHNESTQLVVVNQKDLNDIKEEVAKFSKILSEKNVDDENAKLFTPKETMAILKIKSPKTLWKYRNSGDLPAISFGGKVLFSKATIDAFVKRFSN